MGRTVKPIRYEVEAQLEELRRYLKSLRKQDKEYMDALLVGVKKHISSISYANPLHPNELMQWSALLELERKVFMLQREMERKKDKA